MSDFNNSKWPKLMLHQILMNVNLRSFHLMIVHSINPGGHQTFLKGRQSLPRLSDYLRFVVVCNI